MKCEICYRQIEDRLDENGKVYWSEGNNAAPYEGRCCDACDCLIVIPTRMGMIPMSSISMGQVLLKQRSMSPEELEKFFEPIPRIFGEEE
jgi:hypothetical protein|tara:strand:+ start:8481 stop:8750 length:270 start_codon:yes stop_codon:yes gene_type:complete